MLKDNDSGIYFTSGGELIYRIENNNGWIYINKSCRGWNGKNIPNYIWFNIGLENNKLISSTSYPMKDNIYILSFKRNNSSRGNFDNGYTTEDGASTNKHLHQFMRYNIVIVMEFIRNMTHPVQ